jgi:hypothetical protein
MGPYQAVIELKAEELERVDSSVQVAHVAGGRRFKGAGDFGSGGPQELQRGGSGTENVTTDDRALGDEDSWGGWLGQY